jgi:hypothetical protein
MEPLTVYSSRLVLVNEGERRFYIWLAGKNADRKHYFSANGFVPHRLRKIIQTYERKKTNRAVGLCDVPVCANGS